MVCGSAPEGATLTIRDDDVKLLCMLPETENADEWRRDLLLAARGKLAPEVVYTRALEQSLEQLSKSPVYASSVSDDLTESLKEFVDEATQGAASGADSAGLTGAAPPVPDSMLDVLPFASPSSLGATWERVHGAASTLGAAIKGNLEKKQAGLMGSSYKSRFAELRFTENARGILLGDFVLWPSRDHYELYQNAISSGDMAAAGEVADDRMVLHLSGYEKAVWGGSKKSNSFELRHEGTKYHFRCSTPEIAQEWVASFVSFDELRQVMATRLQQAVQEEVRESGKASAADAFAGAKTRKDSMMGAKTTLASYRSRSGLVTPDYVNAKTPEPRARTPGSPPGTKSPRPASPPTVAKPSPKVASPAAKKSPILDSDELVAEKAADDAKDAEVAEAAPTAPKAPAAEPAAPATLRPSPPKAVSSPATAAKPAAPSPAQAKGTPPAEKKPKVIPASTVKAPTGAQPSGAEKSPKKKPVSKASKAATKAATKAAVSTPSASEGQVEPKKPSPTPAPVVTGRPKPSAKRTKEAAPPLNPSKDEASPKPAAGREEAAGDAEGSEGTPPKKKPAARATPPAPSASPPPASDEPPTTKDPAPKASSMTDVVPPVSKSPAAAASVRSAGTKSAGSGREDSLPGEKGDAPSDAVEQPPKEAVQTSRSSGVSFRVPSPTGSGGSGSPPPGMPSAASIVSSVDHSEGVTPSALARRGVSFSAAPGMGAKPEAKKASPPAAHKSFVASLAAKSAADDKAAGSIADSSRLRSASLRKNKRTSKDPTAEIDADAVRFTTPRRMSVSQSRARANSAGKAGPADTTLSPSAAARRSSAARRKSAGRRGSQYTTDDQGETGAAVTGGGSGPALARTGASKRNPVSDSVHRASVARHSIVAAPTRPAQMSGASATSEASEAQSVSSAASGAPAPAPPVQAAGAVGSSRRASLAFRSSGRDGVGSAARVALMALMDEEDEQEEHKAEQPSSGFGGTGFSGGKPLPPSGPRPGGASLAPQRISPEVEWVCSLQPRAIAERLAPGDLRSTNEMLELYADRGQARSAMGFLHAMLKVGITPNATSYAHLLVAMATAGQVQDAEEAFAALPASIRDSPQYVHCCNALFYAWECNGMLAKALAFVGTDGFGWQTADSGVRGSAVGGPTAAPSPFPIGPRHAAYRLGARKLEEWKLHALLGAAGTARDEGSAQYMLWHALCRGCKAGLADDEGVLPGTLTPSTAAYLLRALTACGALRTAERVFESLLHNQFEELSLVAASSQSMLTALSNLKSKGGQIKNIGGVRLPPSAKGKSDFGLQLGSVGSGGPSGGDSPMDFITANQRETTVTAALAAPGLTAATLATAEKDFMTAMFGEKSSEILRVKRERLHDFVSHQVSVEVDGDTARLHDLSAQTVNDIARSYGLAAAAVNISGVTANEACFAAMIEGYGRSGNVAASQRVFDLFCTVHCTCKGLSENAKEPHPLARVLRAASRVSDSGEVTISAPVDLPHPAPVVWSALLKGLSSEAAIADQDPEALLDVAAAAMARMADIGVPLSAEHYAALVTLHAEADQAVEAKQLAEMAAQNPETVHHVSVHNALIRAAASCGDEAFEYLQQLQDMHSSEGGRQPLQGNCGTIAATIAAHAANGRLHQLQALVDTMLTARVTPSNAVYSELLHAMHSAGEAGLGVAILDQMTASDPGLVHRWGTHIGVSIVQLFAAGGSSDVTLVKAEDVVCMWQALQAPPKQRSAGEKAPPVRRPLMPPRNWQVDGVSEFVVHLSCALHSVVQRLAGAGQLRAAVETVRMWTLAPCMPFGRISVWLWSEEDSEEHVPRIEWSPMNAVAWAHHSAWLRDSVGVVFEWLERSLAVLTVACGAARQLHNSVYLFEGMIRLRARAESAVLWRTGAGSSSRPGMEGFSRAAGRPCDSFARRRTLSGFDQMESLWAPERFPSVPEFAFSRAPPRVPTVGVLMSTMGLDAWGDEGEGWCVEVDALPWHALMQAYLLAGEVDAALGVLPVMQDAGVMPTPSVLVTAIHAAVGGGLAYKAEQLVTACVASAERGHNGRMHAGHGVPPLPDYRLMLEWSQPVVTARLRAAAAARRCDLVVALWQQYTDGVLPHLGEEAGEVPSDAYLFALADVAPCVAPFPVLLPDVMKVLASKAGLRPAPGTHAAQVLDDAGWSSHSNMNVPGVGADTLLQFTRRALLQHLLQAHVPRVSSLTALALALSRNGCSSDARVLLRTVMRHTTGEEYSPRDAVDDALVSQRKEDENCSMRSGLRLPPAQAAPVLDSMGCLQLKDLDAASDGDFVTAGMFDTAFARGLLQEAMDSSAPLQLSDTAGVCDLLLALGETGCVPEVAGLLEFALQQDATVSVVNGIAVAALAALTAAGDGVQVEALWRDHRVDFSLMAERSQSMLQGLQGGLLQFVWQLAGGEVSPEAFTGDHDVTLHGLPAVDAAAVTAVASCRLMSLAARGQVHCAVMGLEACALALQLPLWPEAVTAVLHAVSALPVQQLLAGVRHERGVGVSCVKRIDEVEEAEAQEGESSPSSPGAGRVRPLADGRWVSDTQVQSVLPAPGACGLLCRLEHAAQSMVGAGTWKPRSADVNLLVLLYGLVGETGTALTMAWALLDATATARPGAVPGALGGSARAKACQQAAAVALATSWSAEVHSSAAGQDTSKLNAEHSGMASSGQCDTAEPWRVLRCWGATSPASRAAARSEVLPSARRLLTGVVQGDPAAKVAFGFAGEATVDTVCAAMFAIAVAPSTLYTRGVASRHATRGLEAATAELGLPLGDSCVQALNEIAAQRQGGTRNTSSYSALQSAGGGIAARKLRLTTPEEIMIAAVSALVCPAADQAVGAALAQQELGPGAALASWSSSMAACLTSVPAWRVWRHTAAPAVAGAAAAQLVLSSLGAAVTVAGGITARANLSHATVTHHLARSSSPLDALRTAAVRFSRATPVLNDTARPARLTLEFIERLHSEGGGNAAAASHTADFHVQSIVAQPMGDASRSLRVAGAAGRGGASRSDASGALQRAVELYEAEQSDERSSSPTSSTGGGNYANRFERFDRSAGNTSSPPRMSDRGAPELLVRHVGASDVHDVEAAVMSTQLELDTLAARLTASEQEALRLQAAEEEAEEFARLAAQAQGMVYIPRQSGGEGMHSAEALALNKLRLGILKRASGELRTAEGNMAAKLGGGQAYEERDMYLSFADVRKRLQSEEEAVLDKLHTMESGIKQLEDTFARTLSRFQLGQVERQGMTMEQLRAAARGDQGAVALAVPQDEYRRAAQIVLSPFAVAAVKAQNLRVVRQAQGGQEAERKRQENHTSATVYASALLHTTLEQEHSARLDAVQGWEGALANLGSELADAEAEEDDLLSALEALQMHHATAQSESKGMLSVVQAHRQRLLQELDAVISDVDSRKSAQREGIKAAIRTEEWQRGQVAIDTAHSEVSAALDEIRSTAAEELAKVRKRLQEEITAELQPMVENAEGEAAATAELRAELEKQLDRLQGDLNSIVQSSADMEMRLQSEDRRLSSTLDMVSRREGGALALMDDPSTWSEASQQALLSASSISAATNRDASRLDLRLHLWNLTHTLYSDTHSYVQMLDSAEEIAVDGCQPAGASRSAAEAAHEAGSAASIAMAAAEMGADTDVADMENALFELYVQEYEGLREIDGALPPLPSWGLLAQVAEEAEEAQAAMEHQLALEEQQRTESAQARTAALSKSRRGRRPVSTTPRAAPSGFGSSWSKINPGMHRAAAAGSPGSASVGSGRSEGRPAVAMPSPVRRAATASNQRRAAESKQAPAQEVDHAGLVWRQMTGLHR